MTEEIVLFQDSPQNQKPKRIRKPASEETKAKISQSLKGRVRSKEHCENISKAMLGTEKTRRVKKKSIPFYDKNNLTEKKLSEEHKRNISEGLRNSTKERKKPKPRSANHRRRLSEAGLGRTVSEETRQKIRESLMARNEQNREVQ
jgi:hypothetical protein